MCILEIKVKRFLLVRIYRFLFLEILKCFFNNLIKEFFRRFSTEIVQTIDALFIIVINLKSSFVQSFGWISEKSNE